jgi:hypothetical protein
MVHVFQTYCFDVFSCFATKIFVFCMIFYFLIDNIHMIGHRNSKNNVLSLKKYKKLHLQLGWMYGNILLDK